MGILVKRQRGVTHLTRIARLAITGTLVSFAAAFIDTIWAVYLDSFLNNAMLVGFVSSILTVIAFISYFLIIPYVEKSDKSKIYLASLISFVLIYFLFSLNHNFYLFLLLAACLTIAYTFKITSFGLIIKDSSKNSKLCANEGLIYTSVNLAWVLGPLIAGYAAAELGLSYVFILSSAFALVAIIFFKKSNIKDTKGKFKTDRSFFRNFRDFFKDSERLLSYVLGGGVNLWLSLIYLFIPLLIIRNGLSDLWIGYFLFGIAVPLIILEYPFSKWAGKHGFRKVFAIGYFILFGVSLACFFISNIYLILALLILGSIGLSMIEPTTEAYFFDICRGKEEYRFYGPYNTAVDSGQFFGKISASIALFFFAFHSIFLVYAFFMFLFFLLSFRVKKIVESRRK